MGWPSTLSTLHPPWRGLGVLRPLIRDSEEPLPRIASMPLLMVLMGSPAWPLGSLCEGLETEDESPLWGSAG